MIVHVVQQHMLLIQLSKFQCYILFKVGRSVGRSWQGGETFATAE